MIALEAASKLKEKGIKASVVSIPCFEVFVRNWNAPRTS